MRHDSEHQAPGSVLSVRFFEARVKQAKRRLLLALVLTAAAAYVLLGVVLGLVVVRGDSMEPAFTGGDVVCILRLARDFQVGDVVVLITPAGEELIKRVAATEGDRLPAEVPDGGENGATVPAGSVFVLGDNLAVSRDSRVLGTIPTGLILGKVIWPKR